MVVVAAKITGVVANPTDAKNQQCVNNKIKNPGADAYIIHTAKMGGKVHGWPKKCIVHGRGPMANTWRVDG